MNYKVQMISSRGCKRLPVRLQAMKVTDGEHDHEDAIGQS